MKLPFEASSTLELVMGRRWVVARVDGRLIGYAADWLTAMALVSSDMRRVDAVRVRAWGCDAYPS